MLRCKGRSLRGLLHFLPVFVSSSEKGYIISIESLKSGHYVTGKLVDGMADMRFIIHIINRRGYVIALAHGVYPDIRVIKYNRTSNELAQPHL